MYLRNSPRHYLRVSESFLLTHQRIDIVRLALCLVLLFVVPFSYSQRILKIGISALNPPFETLADQNNHYFGFDVDIIGEICKRMDVHCQFIHTHFKDLFIKLTAHEINLALDAIIITPNRQEGFIFSLPYLESSAQFITESSSAINKPEDIRNKIIGIRGGTLYKNLSEDIYHNQVTVREYLNYQAVMEALHKHDVDVVLMNSPGANYWFANNNSEYKLIGPKIPVGEGYGIMASEDE